MLYLSLSFFLSHADAIIQPFSCLCFLLSLVLSVGVRALLLPCFRGRYLLRVYCVWRMQHKKRRCAAGRGKRIARPQDTTKQQRAVPVRGTLPVVQATLSTDQLTPHYLLFLIHPPNMTAVVKKRARLSPTWQGLACDGMTSKCTSASLQTDSQRHADIPTESVHRIHI